MVSPCHQRSPSIRTNCLGHEYPIKHSTQDNISQFSCNNPILHNVLSTKKVGIPKCQKEWTEQNCEHQNNDRQLLGQTTQIKLKSTFKWTYAEWGEMT